MRSPSPVLPADQCSATLHYNCEKNDIWSLGSIFTEFVITWLNCVQGGEGEHLGGLNMASSSFLRSTEGVPFTVLGLFLISLFDFTWLPGFWSVADLELLGEAEALSQLTVYHM